MFVKIKLEDKGDVQAPHIFSIEDTSTVSDLKTQLESFIHVSSDRQEIKTLDRTLENIDELSKVVNQENKGDKINGAALSLYTNNEFFCFLQLYNQNEGDRQTDFFKQSANACKLPIDQVPQYCEKIIDSEDSWHSTTSESDTSDHSNSSYSSEGRQCPKRKPTPKLISPIKKPRILVERSETNGELLGQAKTMQDVSEKKPCTPVAETLSDGVALSVEVAAPGEEMKNTTVVKKAPQSTASIGEIVNVDGNENAIAPYNNMKPEQRIYALIITNNIDEQNPDYGRLMQNFYGLFESSKVSGRLNFNEYASITAYDGKLWLLCEDNETCDWIATGVRTMNLYKCFSFIKYFGLLKCSMVLPQVVEEKQLENIFHLLELQNLGLCTNKWCVVERSMLDPKLEESAAKTVTNLCKNEELVLYVDWDSKSYIQQHGSKLKYCFWKLTFSF